MSELCHDCAYIFSGGNKENFILSLHDSVPTGCDWLATSKNRRDARFDIWNVVAQGNDLLTDQWAIMICVHCRELHPPIGEVENLQSAGVLQ